MLSIIKQKEIDQAIRNAFISFGIESSELFSISDYHFSKPQEQKLILKLEDSNGEINYSRNIKFIISKK